MSYVPFWAGSDLSWGSAQLCSQRHPCSPLLPKPYWESPIHLALKIHKKLSKELLQFLKLNSTKLSNSGKYFQEMKISQCWFPMLYKYWLYKFWLYKAFSGKIMEQMIQESLVWIWALPLRWHFLASRSHLHKFMPLL